jgi:hypothetical protein
MVIVEGLSDGCQNNDGRKMSYGLHSRYTNVPNESEYAQFPSREYCKTDESFCNMWRTVGFFISFDVAVELCTLVSFVVIISGGVQRRAAGWQTVSTLLLFCAFVQCVGMSIVVCPISTITCAKACASVLLAPQHPLEDYKMQTLTSSGLPL